MKKTFSVLVAFLIQSSLLAAPNAILLQVKSYGGYVPSEFVGHENGLTLYQDGTLESFNRKNALTPPQKIHLAQLSKVAVKTLVQKAQSLRSHRLVSETPGAPVCVDAGVTDYTFYPERGEALIFARLAECHHFFTEEGEARSLKALLDGLKVLVPRAP